MRVYIVVSYDGLSTNARIFKIQEEVDEYTDGFKERMAEIFSKIKIKWNDQFMGTEAYVFGDRIFVDVYIDEIEL
jgi:hypothetical protein